MNDIKVGQKVFVVEKTYRAKEVPRKGYRAVTRVGRKYFYVDNGRWELKFSMETMQEVNDGNYKDSAYLCEQDYDNVVRKGWLRSNIEQMTRGWSWSKDIPLEKMEEIYDLLKEHE